MIKSFILYSSTEKLSNAHRLVTGKGQPKIYVRAKVVKGDIGEALASARPLKGETVLNSISAH
jgi:hypothetical protein